MRNLIIIEGGKEKSLPLQLISGVRHSNVVDQVEFTPFTQEGEATIFLSTLILRKISATSYLVESLRV